MLTPKIDDDITVMFVRSEAGGVAARDFYKLIEGIGVSTFTCWANLQGPWRTPDPEASKGLAEWEKKLLSKGPEVDCYLDSPALVTAVQAFLDQHAETIISVTRREPPV